MRMLAALALAVMACGDDDSGSGTTLTVDNLYETYRSAVCRFWVGCGYFPDRATCLSANLPIFTDGFTFDLSPAVKAAVRAGRVQLDTARVNNCLTLIGSITCDATDREGGSLLASCPHYLRGTLSAGATCFMDEECVSQDCAGGDATITCTPGTCVGDTPPSTEPAALGMPCNTLPGCVQGAFCDFNNTDTCVARRAAGEACFNGDECDYGLMCMGTTAMRVCKVPPVLGEACPDLACRDAGTYCSDSGTCEPIGLPPMPCTMTGFGSCAGSYECDPATLTCVRGPGLGARCASTTSVRCFDYGLVCANATFTCITPRPNGEQCERDAECQSDHCDITLGECAASPVCF